MPVIDLSVHDQDLQRLIEDLYSTPKQVELAMNTTLNKMARWLKTQSVNGLSKHLEIPSSIIRSRLKTYRFFTKEDGTGVKLYYGLNRISMIRLKPKKTSSGVQAGRRVVSGGFVATGKNFNVQVFKRRGADRLPIDSQYASIQQPALDYIDTQLLNGSEFGTVFLQTFERELLWRMQSQK